MFACIAAAGATEPPTAGSKAPDFTLKSEEGKPVKLSSLRGRWIVLYFYPKDFTRGCTIEAHSFQDELPQFEKKKATILGVSVQDANSHKEFCAKEGLHFKLLADTDSKVSDEYGSLKDYPVIGKLSARNTFVIDPKGMIAKTFIGVHPTQHSEEVLAALNELQASKK